MTKPVNKKLKAIKTIEASKLELSYAHISQDEKGLLGVIVASVGPARGHECTYEGEEYQVWADEETLKAWEALSKATEKRLYVRINHTNQPFSKIGYLNNLRLQGPSLVGDIELADVAFTEAMGKKGQAVIDIAKGNDPELICLSLECQGSYVLADAVEPGELMKRAYIRPQILLGVAFVDEGALTDRMFAYSKITNGVSTVENTEKKADEAKKVTGDLVAIEAKQGEAVKATVEIKLDASPVKAEEAKAEPAKAEEVKLDAAADADKAADDALANALSAMSAKLDALMGMLQQMNMDDEGDDAADVDMAKKADAAAPVSDDGKKAEPAIAMSAKATEKKAVIQVLAGVPEETGTENANKNGEPTLAELANPANRKKYWKKYKDVIIDLEYKSRKKLQ